MAYKKAENVVVWAVIVLGVVLSFGYMFWLDAGCARGGVMTWEGKQCVESLAAKN